MRMSKTLKPISAEAFKNKATRIVEIPGFEEGEVIAVQVRSASILSMLVNGKLPNELMATVQSLFDGTKAEAEVSSDILKDAEALQGITTMMSKVCEEVLVSPTYEDIKEYLTDEQKQAIFNATVGNVNQVTPINKK